jgi:hypothetical protein
MQDHPFFGDWMPKKNTQDISPGALDFINGKSLNQAPTNHDGLIEDFQDKKKALKEMEASLTPEDRKLMAQAMGMGGNSDPRNSVANRFREAMKNMRK